MLALLTCSDWLALVIMSPLMPGREGDLSPLSERSAHRSRFLTRPPFTTGINGDHLRRYCCVCAPGCTTERPQPKGRRSLHEDEAAAWSVITIVGTGAGRCTAGDAIA